MEVQVLRAIRRLEKEPAIQDLDQAHKPSVKAALVIFLATEACKIEHVTASDVADVTGVSNVTLAKLQRTYAARSC